MILCIAEKPSVGKEIARILGATNRRDGFYEGNNYLISWTFGHLCTLKAPDDYSDDWKRWDLNFFVLRLDAAAPIADPSYPEGDRWLFGKAPLKRTTLNFGIGYPF